MRTLCLLLLVVNQLSAADIKLVLKNGSIVDGSGRKAYRADIAISRNGHIAAIGNIESADTETIDLAGLTVTPGFIDVHTHAENVQTSPGATNFLRMGVTTLVLGNCGGSRLNIGDYFEDLEDRMISANVATLIGHNTIRSRAMGGSFMRPPTKEEIQKMSDYVDAAMRDGAVGLSTGLIYLPGTFAKTDEIIALARTVGKHGGIYVSHMRSEGDKILGAIDELLQIAEAAGIPAHVSHIKASGRRNWNRSTDILAKLDAARDRGLLITQDQYMYTASSTGISSIIPQEYREGSRADFRDRIADPKLKSEIIARLKHHLKERDEPDYNYAVIAYWSQDKKLNGMRIPAAAEKHLGSDSLDSQIELILKIHSSGGASGVYHKMIEDDLANFQKNPFTMFASDSSIRKMNSGVPHPRGYGNAARVLARYVRELKILKLEDAVRRMTTLPARMFQLKNRGAIRIGHHADLVIFDPAEVQDRATFENPHQYATGFRYVFVNGQLVIQNDKHLGSRPGRAIQRNE
ncbi:MAG: N-acyl-D-amino-acid deacylase family protein [Limisphaerales bacterium]